MNSSNCPESVCVCVRNIEFPTFIGRIENEREEIIKVHRVIPSIMKLMDSMNRNLPSSSKKKEKKIYNQSWGRVSL